MSSVQLPEMLHYPGENTVEGAIETATHVGRFSWALGGWMRNPASGIAVPGMWRAGEGVWSAEALPVPDGAAGVVLEATAAPAGSGLEGSGAVIAVGEVDEVNGRSGAVWRSDADRWVRLDLPDAGDTSFSNVATDGSTIVAAGIVDTGADARATALTMRFDGPADPIAHLPGDTTVTAVTDVALLDGVAVVAGTVRGPQGDTDAAVWRRALDDQGWERLQLPGTAGTGTQSIDTLANYGDGILALGRSDGVPPTAGADAYAVAGWYTADTTTWTPFSLAITGSLADDIGGVMRIDGAADVDGRLSVAAFIMSEAVALRGVISSFDPNGLVDGTAAPSLRVDTPLFGGQRGIDVVAVASNGLTELTVGHSVARSHVEVAASDDDLFPPPTFLALDNPRSSVHLVAAIGDDLVVQTVHQDDGTFGTATAHTDDLEQWQSGVPGAGFVDERTVLEHVADDGAAAVGWHRPGFTGAEPRRWTIDDGAWSQEDMTLEPADMVAPLWTGPTDSGDVTVASLINRLGGPTTAGFGVWQRPSSTAPWEEEIGFGGAYGAPVAGACGDADEVVVLGAVDRVDIDRPTMWRRTANGSWVRITADLLSADSVWEACVLSGDGVVVVGAVDGRPTIGVDTPSRDMRILHSTETEGRLDAVIRMADGFAAVGAEEVDGLTRPLVLVSGDGEEWRQVAVVDALDAPAIDQFASSVARFGDRLVVGGASGADGILWVIG